MREIIRHTYEYFRSEQAGFAIIDDNHQDETISKKHAAVDFLLAGAVVNSILPPTVFAELQRYLPKVVDAIVAWFRQFLGENTLTLFPLINIVFLAAVFSAIEIMIRYCVNGLKKQDTLIHTPLPGIKPISRVEALTICCLAFALETWHGYQQDRHDDSVSAQKLHALFSNPLFTSLGLLNAGRFLAAKVVPPVARCCVTTGLNCLFAEKSHPIRVFDDVAEDNYHATDNSDTQSLRSMQQQPPGRE